MRARILLIAGLLVFVGVSVGGWFVYREFLGEKQVVFELRVEDLLAGQGLEVELRADGQPLPPLPPERRLSLPSRRFRRFSAQAVPELTGRVRLPCGWREISVKVGKPPTAEEFRAARRQGEPLKLSAQLSHVGEAPATFHLYLDNRGGAAAELALGEHRVTLPADRTDELEVVAPDCSEGTRVKLNGQEIGKVPVGQPNPNRQLTYYSLGTPDDSIEGDNAAVVFFLDASGQRCYRLTEKNYSPGGSSPFGGFWAGPADPVYLRRKFLHRLPPTQIDYYFEKAPDQITVSYTSDFKPDVEIRNEFVEVPCR